MEGPEVEVAKTNDRLECLWLNVPREQAMQFKKKKQANAFQDSRGSAVLDIAAISVCC